MSISLSSFDFYFNSWYSYSVDTFLSSSAFNLNAGFSNTTLGSLQCNESDGDFFNPVDCEMISDLGVKTNFLFKIGCKGLTGSVFYEFVFFTECFFELVGGWLLRRLRVNVWCCFCLKLIDFPTYTLAYLVETVDLLADGRLDGVLDLLRLDCFLLLGDLVCIRFMPGFSLWERGPSIAYFSLSET